MQASGLPWPVALDCEGSAGYACPPWGVTRHRIGRPTRLQYRSPSVQGGRFAQDRAETDCDTLFPVNLSNRDPLCRIPTRAPHRPETQPPDPCLSVPMRLPVFPVRTGLSARAFHLMRTNDTPMRIVELADELDTDREAVDDLIRRWQRSGIVQRVELFGWGHYRISEAALTEYERSLEMTR